MCSVLLWEIKEVTLACDRSLQREVSTELDLCYLSPDRPYKTAIFIKKRATVQMNFGEYI